MLNPYAESDAEALERLSREAIDLLISRICVDSRHDGSSTRQGWVYHPIPFDDIQAPVHKNTAVAEFEEVVEHGGFRERPGRRVLDVGSSVGYFSFRLAALGAAVTAFEADPQVYEVAEAIRVFKAAERVRFVNRPFDAEALTGLDGVFDLTLMLNVHMWIYKKLGAPATRDLLRALSRKTRRLLFQTAGAQSGGMYLVEFLRDAATIRAYLNDCGFEPVTHLRDTTAHGGIRSLFLCQGRVS